MNKGIKSIIGAVAGFLLLASIISAFLGDMEFNALTVLLFMPGAIVGAIIGASVGDTENKDKNKDEFGQTANELFKYKQLLDSGIITKEEFDEQKKKILNNE